MFMNTEAEDMKAEDHEIYVCETEDQNKQKIRAISD